MNHIQFQDAVKLIDSGEILKIEYVSLDRNRKTGGKLRTITGKITKKKEDWKPSEEVKKTATKKKNHFANYTRLVRVYQGNRETAVMKPVHLPLITKINDKRMLL